MKKILRFLLLYKLPGFSLIELSVVLIIIGILAGAVLKGQDLIESAKIRSVVHDFQNIALVFSTYQETYGALPGDDALASRWDGITKGNGNHKIEGDEVKWVWMHLEKAGLVSSPDSPSSRFGGGYSVSFAPYNGFDGHWIKLSDGDKGVLNPKQAKALKQRFEGGKPGAGQMQFVDSPVDGKSCLMQGKDDFDLSHTKPACVVLVKLT